MVRTLALIFIISFLAGCAGSGSTSESPSVSAPLGASGDSRERFGCPRTGQKGRLGNDYRKVRSFLSKGTTP